MGARGVQLPSEDAARSARVPTDSSKLPYPVSGTPLALGMGPPPLKSNRRTVHLSFSRKSGYWGKLFSG